MRRYLTLYIKELKIIADMALIFIFLVVIIRLFSSFYDFRLLPRLKFHYMQYVWYILSATFYIIPIMLVYSLNIERISGTHYLALTLPFQKFNSMLSKFFAAVSIGLIVFFTDKLMDMVLTLLLPVECWLRIHSFELGFSVREALWRNISRMATHWFWSEFTGDLSRYVSLCGMVCCAQGVMETVKKNRMLVWTVSFLICLGIYAVLFEPMTHSVIYYSGYTNLGSVTLYRFFVGAVTLIIGLFLYEKYAEV